MSVLNNVEPKEVFKFFEQIANIPHGSFNEKGISDYLKKFAEDRGLEVYQDDIYNIIIIKEASEGYEKVEPIILQGHMDMVCQKGDDVEFDFEKDPLKLLVDGDRLHADRTTLGGDNGIAVAMMLAALDSKTLKHPRLECVITVQEEVGQMGARDIDLSMLKGKRFINIDSEEEGVFSVSCAGGVDVHTKLPVSRKEHKGVAVELTISGLKGGHSGILIHLGRANSHILMGRLLDKLNNEMDIRIDNLEGGSKGNVIASYTKAIIVVDSKDAEKVSKIAKEYEAIFSHEFKIPEDKVVVDAKELAVVEANALDKESTDKLIEFLMIVPQGVQNMSFEIEDLVETSLNLGAIILDKEEFRSLHTLRSAVATRKDFLVRKLQLIAKVLGGQTRLDGAYPGWEYNPNSPLRDRAIATFEAMYGYEPKIEALHAGLECGFFSDKIKGLDCISIGPNLKAVHSENEELSIESTKRVWDFLVKLIEEK